MYVPVSPTLAEWDDCPMAVLVWSREIYANQYGWFNELLKLSMHVLSADGLNIGSSVKKSMRPRYSHVGSILVISHNIEI
jgi:hypothetical protein